MNPKQVLIGGAVLALIGLASPAAATDNITSGVWYAGDFAATGSPLLGGGSPGTSPSGVSAPAGSTWTITLSKPEVMSVVDVERAGDQFEMFDNGVELGLTSTPTANGDYVGECISCAFADPAFSRGYFLLPAGVNVISGIQLGTINFGDMDFTVGGGVPEPATWALMLAGIGGLGAALRSRRKALTAPT